VNLLKPSSRFAAEIPKVELHVHLEGSIQPTTLLELARRRRVTLPADDAEGLRQWFRFRDFEHFVEIYLTCCRCLRDPEDFQLVMEQFLAEQQRQNVLYSEVHFTIGTHLANGVNGEEVAAALFETLAEAESRFGVRARLIPDIVRDVGSQRADETLEWALAGRGRGVAALGLSGFESSPDEPYREHFQVALQEGLHRVAHAGEHEGPATIRSALDVCQAERIGHGIRAVDDPDLVAELANRGTPLEICPTSNVRLGAVSEIGEHPFDRLWRAGVAVTVNSDDPPQFETTITDEYRNLAQAFGYGAADLASFSWTALQQAFLEPTERARLEREFKRRFLDLGVALENERFDVVDGSVA
jgi:adenosine deaminase